MLRVDDLALETIGSFEVRRVALVVAVVAAAEEEEPAGERHCLPRVGPLDLDGPARILGRPVGALHAVAEADLLVDAVHARGVADVLANGRPVRDRLGVRPRPEPEAQRVHVGVGPDPGIPEEVPGAADRVARLEDGVALPRALVLQVVAGADAREARPHHEDVDVLLHNAHYRSSIPGIGRQ